jgi:hypothetical protein
MLLISRQYTVHCDAEMRKQTYSRGRKCTFLIPSSPRHKTTPFPSPFVLLCWRYCLLVTRAMLCPVTRQHRRQSAPVSRAFCNSCVLGRWAASHNCVHYCNGTFQLYEVEIKVQSSQAQLPRRRPYNIRQCEGVNMNHLELSHRPFFNPPRSKTSSQPGVSVYRCGMQVRRQTGVSGW